MNVVEDVQQGCARFGYRGGRPHSSPSTLIYISFYSHHRSNGAQGVQDLGLADIARMDDQVRTLERP